MSTGDQKYIDEFKDGTSKLGAYEDNSISRTMSIFLKAQLNQKHTYNYNGLLHRFLSIMHKV